MILSIVNSFYSGCRRRQMRVIPHEYSISGGDGRVLPAVIPEEHDLDLAGVGPGNADGCRGLTPFPKRYFD